MFELRKVIKKRLRKRQGFLAFSTTNIIIEIK